MTHRLESLLPFVEKPGRYLGLEMNTVRKNRGDCIFSFCFAFPDVYEVGMSHLGLAILYSVVNREKNVVAERCFAPWPDMEKLMREKGILLPSLESGTPLRAFDMVGFSLQYELSFTNVLTMLDLGGIPLKRHERREDSPIICAGGPCAFNPAPMSEFVDVFVIGEGEEVILEIIKASMEAKKKGKKRKDILEILAQIEGVYCPEFHADHLKVRKRVIADLNDAYFPDMPPVPLIKAIHDRITIEIARGCTRGCRFCQAGMVWRPVRERNSETIEKMVEALVSATGQDEISLLALSAGDYTQITPLVKRLVNRYHKRRIALALPSLRAETLTKDLIDQIRRVRKTSFTLAPEAGTQRLRDVINKCNTEEDLLTTVERVFEAGWRAVKLYFMIGLPGEKEGDIYGIADLAMRALERAKRGGQITVSVSTFVPKAHTPFQWEPQISLEETREKQHLLKNLLRHRRLELRWHDSKMSLLEGLFSRGDAELGRVVERAFRKGCRFDGWADVFKFDLWQEVIDELGVDIERRMAGRQTSETLPWEFVDCGLRKEFLISELMRARRAELTKDCRTDGCLDCGVCNEKIRPKEAKKEELFVLNEGCPNFMKSGEGFRYRLLFTKKGKLRFLSHLEVASLLQRALMRAHLPLFFTEGFRPHPRISFGHATSVGMESEGEYVDVYFTSDTLEADELRTHLNPYLPQGVKILAAWKVPVMAPSLAESMISFTYTVHVPPRGLKREKWKEKIEEFFAREVFEIIVEKKGKSETREIRHLVESLYLDERGNLKMTVRFGPQGTVNPVDILVYVFGISREKAKSLRIVKESTSFNTILLTEN